MVSYVNQKEIILWDIERRVYMEVRFFTANDAPIVLSWIASEREFRMWAADSYKNYPLTPKDMIDNYVRRIEEGEFYPLVFEEKGKIIGHLILRYPTSDKKNVRLGYIIVDKKKRGKGYGTKMIFEAMRYAAVNLGATKFNLGVFTNNSKAYKCYSTIGFKTVSVKKSAFDFYGEKWDWEEMVYDPAEKLYESVKKHLIDPFLKGKN